MQLFQITQTESALILDWETQGRYSAGIDDWQRWNLSRTACRKRYRDVIDGEDDTDELMAKFEELPLLAQAIVCADLSPGDSFEFWGRDIYASYFA